MRIAYVLGRFPSLSETFVLRELDALRRAGCEVVVMALIRDDEAKRHRDADELLRRVPIHYAGDDFRAALGDVWFWLLKHPLRCLGILLRLMACACVDPVWGLRVLRRYPVAARFARQAVEAGVEHLHAHFASLPADVARMMSGLSGISHSVSAHAWDVYAQGGGRIRRALAGARFVAVCSEHARQRLVDLGLACEVERVVLIRHGVDAGHCRAGSGESGFILAVGRLEPKKGFGVLVEACGILRGRRIPFRCTIVGDGSEQTGIERLILRLGLSDVVSLAGSQTQEALRPMLERAAVFVLPSVQTRDGDRDGISNAILEALAAGVPVVTSTASAASEAVIDGESGFLVAPGDSGALAEKIERLLGDPALCRALGDAGRRTVRADFDVARNVEKLRVLFERAIRGE